MYPGFSLARRNGGGYAVTLVHSAAPLAVAGWPVWPRPASRPSGTFNVNSLSDVSDGNIGDGSCETVIGNSTCMLRAAVQEASASPNPDTHHGNYSAMVICLIHPAPIDHPK